MFQFLPWTARLPDKRKNNNTHTFFLCESKSTTTTQPCQKQNNKTRERERERDRERERERCKCTNCCKSYPKRNKYNNNNNNKKQELLSLDPQTANRKITQLSLITTLPLVNVSESNILYLYLRDK